MRALVAASFLSLLAASVNAQTPVRLVDVMSAADMQATGVSNLSADQRAALEAWLGRYSRTVASGSASASAASVGESPTSASGSYVPSGTGASQEFRAARNPVPGSFRIATIDNGGRTLVLEDGSVWEVYAPDRPMVAAWKVNDAVLVRRTSARVDEVYDFRIMDGPSGRSATVRWAGR